MKFNKKDFKEFVLNEAIKYAKEEGFSFEIKESSEPIQECGCEKEQENEFTSQEEFETVEPEEFLEEAKEAKTLSEELDRMKQLLSFNNPLLKKIQ